MTLDLKAFLDELSKTGAPNDEIYSYLSVTDCSRLRAWLQRLERVRGVTVKGRSAAEKKAQKARLLGKILEKAVRVLLDGCECITHSGNVRTTTSEIDFLLKVEPLGALIPLLRDAGTHAIGEAKCYSSAPKSEWVNEFVGVLGTHAAKLGILFTACPAKPLRVEIRTAIAIHAGRGSHIVPFGITQLLRVQNGDNFLRVLEEQAIAARTHTAAITI